MNAPARAENRIAVMQPYFMPYIGYFQLIAAVDEFVLLDDVAFINRGWVNRNRIWSAEAPHWMTVPLAKASQNRLINEIEIVSDMHWRLKLMRMIRASYRGAPFFTPAWRVLDEILSVAQGNLSIFLRSALRMVLSYVGLTRSLTTASETYPRGLHKGADRIVDICSRAAATTYVNAPGGRDLYDHAFFAVSGVRLLFLEPSFENLPVQCSDPDGKTLSILDLMMLNPPDVILRAANAFRLSQPDRAELASRGAGE